MDNSKKPRLESPPTDYFKFGKAMLRVWGLWPYHGLSPNLNRLYRAYGIFVIFTTLVPYNVCFAVDIMVQFSAGSWMAILPRLSVALAILLGCVKVAVYLFHTKKIEKFMTMYEGETFTHESCGDFQPNDIIRRCIRLYNMQVLVCFGLIGILIMTDVDALLKEPIQLGINITVPFLPFVNWLPYDFSESPAYEISFILTNIWFFVTADIIFIYDTICMGLIIHTTGQLKILRKALESLRFRAFQDMNIYYEITGKKPPDEIITNHMRFLFRKCAVHHQQIIKHLTNFQSIFSLMIFLQFCISCLMICFTILIVTSANDFTLSSRITSMIVLLCSMWELSVYCYFGNEIIYQSNRLSESIYKSDWYAMDKSIKTSMLIMMTRSLKPIYFTAGSFVPLSLETFIAILKGSYSYYTFLRSVADK